MYQLDVIESAKTGSPPRRPSKTRISSTVWQLGWTSLLTDISSEMVNSLLPVYLVLFLHMSPLQYGAIDGVYNGIGVALLSLAGGVMADRTRRHKQIAAVGYSISAGCKLLLLIAGGAWSWIIAAVALDRLGKGARTAPRDALISFSTPEESRATAFAVHRAMDAAGALLGPITAFLILTLIPTGFDAAWVTAFVFALLGVAVLWLFVQNPRTEDAKATQFSWRMMTRELVRPQFRVLVLLGGMLSLLTLSDGFVYLLIQQRTGTPNSSFPLFYIATSAFYMVLAVPLGRVADRWGKRRIFLLGYFAVASLYLVLLGVSALNKVETLGCLVLFGFYYAATEGVLTALASSVSSAQHRGSGLAVLRTAISLGNLVSSLAFGALWQTRGTHIALIVFALTLPAAIGVAAFTFHRSQHARPA